MAEIVYSEAHPGDEPALAAFHRFADPSIFTREYFSYRAEQSVFAVGKDGDRLVASEAMMPYELSVCGERMLTGRSERTLVDPAYRGRDLWQNVLDFCAARARERGMAFVWGSTSARRAFEKVGFSFLSGHRVHLYALASPEAARAQLLPLIARGELSPFRLRERLRRREMGQLEQYASAAGALPSWLLRTLTRAPLRLLERGYAIESEPRAYADLDALYARLGVRERDLYLPQDEAFYRWLLARTGLSIGRHFAYDGSELAGYVYVAPGPNGVASVVDFAFIDARAAAALLARALDDASAHGAAFVKLSLNVKHAVQARYIAPALACGYLPLYRGGSHVVMPLLYTNRSVLEDMARWYLTDLWYAL